MIDIKGLLNWSAPKRVRTAKGECDLLKAAPTQEFSDLWKSSKAQLQAAHISWMKEKDGSWIVAWWRPIDAAEAQAKALTLEASKATNAAIAIPCNAGLKYLGYQKAGVAYALEHQGTLIGDEMGLGKTIQAIGVINADPTIKNVVVVCPASLKINWAKELRKWLTRPLSIQMVGSGAGWGRANITLINYEMLAKYGDKLAGDGVEFDLAVIDESHRVKNPKAQCTRVFSQIKAKRRISMSGTPILNKPVELWSTLIWLDPVRWTKKKSFFERRYCGAYQGQWGWVNDGATHLDELQEVLRTTVMIRRMKKDVLTELPPKQRQVIELECDGTARKAANAELSKWNEFEELRTEAKKAKADAKKTDDAEAYAAAVAMLEEANAVAFESMSRVRHETAVAKVQTVVEFVADILESNDDKKLVLFAHHQDVIQAFMQAFVAYNPVKLVGGMNPQDKNASVERFQTDPTCRLFIGSTLAAGVGITLTAASHVVFAELDWTPARVTQAEDRCHRIGQTDSVLVQHLVLEGSLDAMMAQMIVDKQDVADRALDKAGKPIEAQKQVTAIEVQVQPEAAKAALSAAQIKAAHTAMQMLAGVCDGARTWDGAGFNKFDSAMGKSLAAQGFLTAKQAAIAARLANKYRKQLGDEILDVIKGQG